MVSNEKHFTRSSYFAIISLLFTSLHKNKKALSPFYHKKIFLMENEHPLGVLHLFSIKNIFHDKMDLRLFYFHVTTCKLQGTRSLDKYFIYWTLHHAITTNS